MPISSKLLVVVLFFSLFSCQEEKLTQNNIAIEKTFGSSIDLQNLANYANQLKPAYIVKDNSANNKITNAKATLGRVLFYDKNLSVNNTISCSSCHKQAQAFADVLQASKGVNGNTGRHSMRLINARFSTELKFFLGRASLNLRISDNTTHTRSRRDGF